MKRFLTLILASTLASALAWALGAAVATAEADSGFRCESGRLVRTGDHMIEVRHKCGEPDMVTQRIDKRRVKHKVRRWVNGESQEVSEEQEVEVLVDEWTYDLGPRRFIRMVSFENSRVVCVATGDYGKKP
jgi:hypothetical protein